MEFDFWRVRWEEGRTAFHEPAGNRALQAQWSGFRARYPAGPQRVLVPLCGKTPDLTWLAEQGHEVVGVEFVDEAARAYFAEAGVVAERNARGSFVEYRHEHTSIWVADFFQLGPSILGHFDLVYDRAALVAISPEQRSRYVAHLARLCRPAAGLFLISFEHDIGSGPPFSVDDVAELFGDSFSIERRAVRDVLATEPRFKERGATRMHEITWWGTRTPGLPEGG